jgi:hypothetical protein
MEGEEGGNRTPGAQVSHCCIVAAGKNGGHLRREHRMLESEPDCRSGSPSGATANGIHDHQHGAAFRPQQAVNILGSSRLFYTVSGQILPHCSDEWFGIRHDLILHWHPGAVESDHPWMR